MHWSTPSELLKVLLGIIVQTHSGHADEKLLYSILIDKGILDGYSSQKRQNTTPEPHYMKLTAQSNGVAIRTLDEAYVYR